MICALRTTSRRLCTGEVEGEEGDDHAMAAASILSGISIAGRDDNQAGSGLSLLG
jgi:hypothetical protein